MTYQMHTTIYANYIGNIIKMKAGILKNQIGIYTPVITTTDYGNTKTEYELVTTTRANVRYNSGSRVVENDEIFYPHSKTFIVRHYVQVTEPMRIKYEDKFYRIISINFNQTYRDKEIIAELVNE